jgi:hypothetical protein
MHDKRLVDVTDIIHNVDMEHALFREDPSRWCGEVAGPIYTPCSKQVVASDICSQLLRKLMSSDSI